MFVALHLLHDKGADPAGTGAFFWADNVATKRSAAKFAADRGSLISCICIIFEASVLGAGCNGLAIRPNWRYWGLAEIGVLLLRPVCQVQEAW